MEDYADARRLRLLVHSHHTDGRSDRLRLRIFNGRRRRGRRQRSARRGGDDRSCSSIWRDTSWLYCMTRLVRMSASWPMCCLSSVRGDEFTIGPGEDHVRKLRCEARSRRLEAMLADRDGVLAMRWLFCARHVCRSRSASAMRSAIGQGSEGSLQRESDRRTAARGRREFWAKLSHSCSWRRGHFHEQFSTARTLLLW